MRNIPFNIPPATGREPEYLAKAIANHKLCGDGPFTKQCHQWLEERTGAPKALLTTSGTSALEMAALLCNVQPGDEVQAMVLRRDDGQGNILLSRADAADVLAWDRLKELQDSGEVLDVVVKGIVNGGAIAYVEGVRGFIPASRLALEFVEDTEVFLNKPIQVRVIEVDKAKKRLVLSAREILRERAEVEKRNKISNIQVGFVTEGTVESLQPYGAFVELGNGVSGLVHISQICEKRIRKPSEVLSVGDKVKVKVIAIKDGKLSLSIKEASDLMAKEVEEESFELPESGEEATTSLGALFANIKL